MKLSNLSTTNLLTVSELASLMNVNVSTLRYLCHAKKIPHFKIGRLVRFEEKAIAEWLEAQRRQVNN